MGGCLSIGRNSDSAVNNSSDNVTRPSSGRKNHPLCHDTIRWKSDVPLTEGQLRSRRDEFWDTAPVFDGRKEIWDALRAASVATEALDFDLAQAILDGANISVPNGDARVVTGVAEVTMRACHRGNAHLTSNLETDPRQRSLTECYDELGTLYRVPVYCLSNPINMVKEYGRESPADCSEPADGGMEVILKLRLSSTGTDVKLPVLSTDTIAMAKKKLQLHEGLEPSRQRWFFGGKLLSDKFRVEEAKIQPGYVVQVIVNPDHNDGSMSRVES